ncbi:MAG: LamG-like jellyroll fold domain-containing protein [Bacteroidota bacterium]
MKKLLYISFVMLSTFSFGQPLVIAHRGGAGMAPENTLSAFHKAVEINADYFELDVMISGDDSLMIMHDATVDRTTDGTGTVSSMTYDQLRALDAGSWFSTEFTGEKIPTLWESLMVAKNSPNQIGVVIEIKSSDTRVPSMVVDMIHGIGMGNRVIVSSFSLAQLTEVKSLDPTISVQLFGTISESSVDQVVAINGDWVGSGGTLTQTVIDYAHMQGIYFNAWTLNSAATMQPAIDLGVDAITTDYPLLLLTLMDDTEPSDVVLSSATPAETRVLLNWEPATDPESGIAGYDIFRDEVPGATTLLASVGNVTEYLNETYEESRQYYYRIKARNVAGLRSVNFSNEVAVTTLNDVTPPEVVYITSRGDSGTVVVGFSERIDRTSAETAANYTINYGNSVLSALLARDQKSVILTTTPLSEQSYILTIKSVKDRALSPNTIATAARIFLHYGIPESAVAFYMLDTLPFEDPDYLVVDETENANNGIVRNGAFPTEGVLGNGIGFDGVDDYVEFQASESFNIDGSGVTLALWTKLPAKPSELPGPYAPLFDSETDNYVLYGDRGNKELRFKVVTSAGAERPGIPDADIPPGEWIHVAGVYDGTQAKVYLNGVLKDSHPLTGTVKPGQVATLGKSGSTYLNGFIDQVEVYSRALSEEEIMVMYTGTNEEPISRNPGNVILEEPVVEETAVTLTWSEAVNYESGIMGYEIYRDISPEPDTLYATVGNVTEFTDNTSAENQTYYYRVKAKNTLGLLSKQFSNEVSATTGTDLTRPLVTHVTSRGDNPGIIIEFSEKLEPASATNLANYAVDQSVTITAATLTADERSVMLSTTDLAEQSYILTLTGIMDQAAKPNQILPGTRVIFTHETANADLVAWYRMTGMPLEGQDTLLLDETENANDGLVKNEPVVEGGLLGNALKFDHTRKQYVQFENSPSFDINDTVVSISVWTKLTYLPREMPEAYGPLFDSEGDQYVIYADRGNKELRFKVVTNVKAERPGIPNDDLVTGQWINVFAVYDGSSAKIYLNGILKDSHSITGTVKEGNIPMLAKSRTSGSPAYFNGSIDNVMVFKKAFTDGEIMQMYENYRLEAVIDCDSYDLLEEATICSGESYTFPDGTVGDENMVHVSELTSIYGCDSIITTTLTVSSVDLSVSLDNGVITATVSGGSYRWLDCDNGYAEISGETGQAFTPLVAGNYAVEITLDGCTDTTDCIYAEPVGFDPNQTMRFSVYPNPSHGIFYLAIGNTESDELRVEIMNTAGSRIFEKIITGPGLHQVDLSVAHPGVYLIRVVSGSAIQQKQIVVL